MYILKGENLKNLIPLLTGGPIAYPLAKGTLEGLYDGWALADEKENPEKALLFHSHSGFLQYLGQSPNHDAAQKFANAAVRYKSDRSYSHTVEFAHCPTQIAKLIQEKQQGITSYRRISWNHNHRLFLKTPNPLLPKDCTIRLINESDLSHSLVKEETVIFWNNEDDFLKNTIGVIALDKEEQILGVCSSVSDSDNYYEINIEVNKNHRKQGLGYAMAHHFISECYNRGKLPHWDCIENNIPSQTLAKKLGFTEAGRYPLISWKY